MINNTYFGINNGVFRQVIGIPMGSDPAPFFANLFLFHFECQWMEHLRKNDLRRGKKFLMLFASIMT